MIHFTTFFKEFFFLQDVSDKNSIRYPKLYTPGLMNLLFNKMIFLKSVAHGLLTSFILFFIPYGAFSYAVDPNGLNIADHQLFGTTVSTILVLVVTVQVRFEADVYHTFFFQKLLKIKALRVKQN